MYTIRGRWAPPATPWQIARTAEPFGTTSTLEGKLLVVTSGSLVVTSALLLVTKSY